MDRLVQAVVAHEMSVSARTHHAAAAATAGLALRPTKLIFGNPEAVALLMQAAPSIGIDLPLKGLVREEADGTIRLGFQMPHWLAGHHAIGSQAATGRPGQEHAGGSGRRSGLNPLPA